MTDAPGVFGASSAHVVRRSAYVAIALLLLATACHKGDPVRATLDAVVDAAEAKDAGEVMAYISAEYHDESGGRAQVEQNLRRYFFAYQNVNVTLRDVDIQRSGSSATATFVADFTGNPKQIGGFDQLLPSAAQYRFTVWLADEGGTWRIVSAHWER